MSARKKAATLAYRRCRFSATLPLAFLYSKTHYWLAAQPDGSWRIGMTKFATRLAGETVELGFQIAPGAALVCGQVIGFHEGFKGLSDLRSVLRGSFLGGNPALLTDIALVNRDPHGTGWLYAASGRPAPSCLDARGYARHLDGAIDRLRAKG